MDTASVAVIGAGPAGLAVGACLKKAGIDFVMLEREQKLAPSWRRHYERLHLHTVKNASSLPFLPFPADYPRYVSRLEVIRYLETYAVTFGLEPRFGERVRSVRRDAEDWIVEAERATVRAPFLVIASGNNAEPIRPIVPGIEAFKGETLHAADYVNAKSFAGRSVLVIGMGNSGAEIALDLAEGGARPTISIRNGVHIAPRDLFGIPIQWVALLAAGRLPRKFNDTIFPPILDLALGYPAKYGLRRPQEGILEQAANRGRIPMLDVGTMRKVREGAIKVAPGIGQIAANGIHFNDGQKAQFDAIIFATGFRPNYQDFLADEAAMKSRYLDSRLFFVGFHNPITGLLRQISADAVKVTRTIAAARKDMVSPGQRDR